MTGVVGIIPARGGSKRILRKNLAPLAGRPLLAYTCDAAHASTVLDRVILSTDDEEIAAVGRANDVEVPFLRPAELAGDDVPSVAVVLHVLDWLREQESTEPEIVVLLQPTSPLRRAEHVDRSVALLRGSSADAVVTVVEVPHVFHPVSAFTMGEGGVLSAYVEGEGTRLLRGQDKSTVWARSGPAVCASRVESVRREGSLYGSRTLGLPIGRLESLDIDDADDLAVCEALLHRRDGG